MTEETVQKPHPEKTFTDKIRSNPWILSTLVLAVIVIILFAFTFGQKESVKISKDDARQIVIDFIQSQTKENVELLGVNETSGLYEVMVLYSGQEIPVYITRDGKNLIQGLVPLPEVQNQDTIPENDKPAIEISADDDAFLGPENAKVVVVEFSDFECPFCGAAAGTRDDLIAGFKSQDSEWEAAVPKLKELAEQGKIKFVFRDFPLDIHKNSQKAAEAAECAGEQGKFWEYHDRLFENQGLLDINSLKVYALEIGLDINKFNECLDSEKMEDEVKKDLEDGKKYGVRGTPAFFVNGKLISGAQSFSVIEKVINEELAGG